MKKIPDLDQLPDILPCKECGQPLGFNAQGCDTCLMDWWYSKQPAKCGDGKKDYEAAK